MTIKLLIAQRSIELVIQKEWEEYYRKAEKMINESFFNFAKKWTYTDHQDILSKILINFVVQGIETEERTPPHRSTPYRGDRSGQDRQEIGTWRVCMRQHGLFQQSL